MDQLNHVKIEQVKDEDMKEVSLNDEKKQQDKQETSSRHCIKREFDDDEQEEKKVSINNVQQQHSVGRCTKVKKGKEGGDCKVECDCLECRVQREIKIEFNQSNATANQQINLPGPSNVNKGASSPCKRVKKKEKDDDRNDCKMKRAKTCVITRSNLAELKLHYMQAFARDEIKQKNRQSNVSIASGKTKPKFARPYMEENYVNMLKELLSRVDTCSVQIGHWWEPEKDEDEYLGISVSFCLPESSTMLCKTLGAIQVTSDTTECIISPLTDLYEKFGISDKIVYCISNADDLLNAESLKSALDTLHPDRWGLCAGQLSKICLKILKTKVKEKARVQILEDKSMQIKLPIELPCEIDYLDDLYYEMSPQNEQEEEELGQILAKKEIAKDEDEMWAMENLQMQLIDDDDLLGEIRNGKLGAIDCDKVARLEAFMNVFKDYRNRLAVKDQPSLSLVMPTKLLYIKTIQESACNLWRMRREYYVEEIQKKFVIHKMHIVASYLDPFVHFLIAEGDIEQYFADEKKRWNSLMSVREIIKSELKFIIEKMEENRAQRTVSERAIKNLDIEGPRKEDDLEREMSNYDRLMHFSKDEARNSASLAFWRKHQSKYPLLAAVAQTVLSCPSSQNFERLLNRCALKCNRQGTELLPENVNRFVFNHDNEILKQVFG